MNRKKNQWVKMAFVGVLVLLLGVNLSFGRLSYNGSTRVYVVSDEKNSFMGMDSLDNKLIMAAKSYMKANLEIEAFLIVVEMQDIEGVDFVEMQKLIDRAIDNMNTATEIYLDFFNQAQTTPYNKEVIEQLKQFNYDEFRLKYGLVGDVFHKVEFYLSRGDINGMFKETYTNCSEMLNMLKTMKLDIQQYRLPELSLCWQINEKFAAASLFGSYVARIFLTSIK